MDKKNEEVKWIVLCINIVPDHALNSRERLLILMVLTFEEESKVTVYGTRSVNEQVQRAYWSHRHKEISTTIPNS